MSQVIPPEMLPLEEEVQAARRKFVEAARGYDAALEKFMDALRAEKVKAAAKGRDLSYYDSGIMDIRQRQRELLHPILDYFEWLK